MNKASANIAARLEPLRKAVPAEAREIHQIDVLDVRTVLQPLEQRPKRPCLEQQQTWI